MCFDWLFMLDQLVLYSNHFDFLLKDDLLCNMLQFIPRHSVLGMYFDLSNFMSGQMRNVQSADFRRTPTKIEIEYTRFNRYDGLKALTEKKLAKGKFSTVGEFLDGTKSELGSESSSKDDNEEEGDSDNEEEWDSENDMDPWE